MRQEGEVGFAQLHDEVRGDGPERGAVQIVKGHLEDGIQCRVLQPKTLFQPRLRIGPLRHAADLPCSHDIHEDQRHTFLRVRVCRGQHTVEPPDLLPDIRQRQGRVLAQDGIGHDVSHSLPPDRVPGVHHAILRPAAHAVAVKKAAALDLVLTAEQVGYFMEENTVQLRQGEVGVCAYHHAVLPLAPKSLCRKGLEIALRLVVLVQVLRKMLPAELLIDLQPVFRGKESKDCVIPCDAGVKGVVEEVQGVKKDVP